ncbi:TetR/AcrR family transcriptional regulator [Streptomyces albus]|uniref:TetR/AcrR family transcriptional regulator n=1 Tax=Streptomyces albus TaxID=1888 RepID=UPI00099D7F1F|nr:TetR/AcrR family transcriptional regulator [Streptomyces albus]
MPAPKTPDARRIRAQLTRRRILDAAMELFSEHGYEATTIASIAREAGVAVQTVYFAFGNKQRLLRDLITLHLPCGGARSATETARAMAGALTADGPRQQLRHLVRCTRTINEHAAPLLEVLRNADVTQDDGEDMWQSNKDQRRLFQSEFIQALTAERLLPDGLVPERAVDICYALLGPELYHLLASERKWTQEQWEDWVYEGLCRHLLRTGT